MATTDHHRDYYAESATFDLATLYSELGREVMSLRTSQASPDNKIDFLCRNHGHGVDEAKSNIHRLAHGLNDKPESRDTLVYELSYLINVQLLTFVPG
jgi:hypothetical protein